MNSFQPGNMGVAEGVGLIFVTTFPTVFLSTPAMLTNQAGSLVWAASLIHGTTALILFLTLSISLRHGQGNLFNTCRSLLGRFGAYLIFGYLTTGFFMHFVFVLRQYAENTLLTALPLADFSVIIMVYGMTAGILVYIGAEGMARASYLLIPFMIIALLVVLALLAPFYNFYRIAPWTGFGLGTTVLAGLKAAGVNFAVLGVAVIASSFQQLGTLRSAAVLGLGISTLLRGLSVFVYIIVFGSAAGAEKILPFFEMARLVYLSRYLQRIESLFIMLWVISGLLEIALSLFFGLYCIAAMASLPTIRPLIPVTVVILAGLAMLPPDVMTTIQTFTFLQQNYLNAGLYAIPVILLIASYIKNRKGQ